MKAIITIRGSGNRGKTTLLCSFANFLIKNGAQKIEPSNFSLTNTYKDVQILLRYKDINIAICSSGDTLAIVKENVRFAFNVKTIDILFLAIRSFGESMNFIQDLAKKEKLLVLNVENNIFFEKESEISTFQQSQLEYLEFIVKEFVWHFSCI